MSEKQEYRHISKFEEALSKMKNKPGEFYVTSTSYTKRIHIPGERKVFFNDKGEQDGRLLTLISLVRKDAEKFLSENDVSYSDDIDFFNLFEVPKEKEIIKKIDLSAAYWTYARKRGVITEDTHQRFLSMYAFSFRKVRKRGYYIVDGKIMEYERAVSEFKDARLKALGSLATRKLVQKYKDGRIISEELIVKETRPLYMEICRGIDKLMRECREKVPGCIYYYWDCIFVKDEFSEEAINFFKERDYASTTKETTIDFVKIGDMGFLISTSDDKIYMTRRENKHLFENIFE